MPTSPIPVVVDVDTGVDDALALLFLVRQPGIDLRAVSCVAGNTDVEQATQNTLDVLAVAGAEHVQVARGAERPLVNRPHDAHAVHGNNGLGDLRLPTSRSAPCRGSGIELIKEAVERSAEPITLLGLGPLTNIALFLRTYPEHARRLSKIVFMGGSAGIGNASPVAEFNAWHDPEALAMVIDSGLPVIMYGLDVFYQPVISDEVITSLLASNDDVTHLAGQLLHFAARENQDHGITGGATIGDAGAACLLADPDAVTLRDYRVLVELCGHARGQTLVDRRTRGGESEAHGLAAHGAMTSVATEIDAARVVDSYLHTLSPGLLAGATGTAFR